MIGHRVLMCIAILASLASIASGPGIRSAGSVLAADPELRPSPPKPQPRPRVKVRRSKPRPVPVEEEPDPPAASRPPPGAAVASPRPAAPALDERATAIPRAHVPLRPASLVGRWNLNQDQDIAVSIHDQQPDGAFRGRFDCGPRFSGSVNGKVTVNGFRMLMHWSVMFVKGRRELNGACDPSGDHIQGNWAGNAGLGMASGSFRMDRVR